MKRMKLISVAVVTAAVVTTSLLFGQPRSYSTYGYRINATYPHSTTTYTQGLEFADGVLYESGGLYGQSSLMRVDLATGQTHEIAKLNDAEFGEGITIMGDTIFMITWREGAMHMFSRKSGEKIETKRYAGEGWGITSDGKKLYMSDGSSKITTRDPKSFMPLSSHTVTLDGRPVPYLNELEWIDGKIWANVYTTDNIVIIDPTTWCVDGVIDLTALLPLSERTPETDVLNGIAYDKASGKIYVTGKNWSRLYEIEIIKR